MTIHPAVYILASDRNGTLYAGVTSDLLRRIWQHRTGQVHGFTDRYRIHHLVHYETLRGSAHSHHAREAIEEPEASVEVAVDRREQPNLERSLGADLQLTD